MVEQADAAVRAVVDGRVAELHRPLAARADALRKPRQRHVVGQLLAALGVGASLGEFLPFEVAVEGQDSLPANHHGHDDPHHMAHVATVIGQVRHEFDEEGEQREEHEAPHEGPPGAPALPGEQPARRGEQRQGQGQPVQEHPQLLPAQAFVQPAGRLGFERLQRAAGALLGLPCIEGGLLLGFHRGQRPALGGLEGIQRRAAADQLGVLLRLPGRLPGGQPVGIGLAGAGGVGTLGVELEAGLVQRLVGRLPGLAGLLDGRAGLPGRRLVDEVLEAEALLHLGQVAHDGAAQPDQETGKRHRHQPQAGAEPFLGQPQGLVHDTSSRAQGSHYPENRRRPPLGAHVDAPRRMPLAPARPPSAAGCATALSCSARRGRSRRPANTISICQKMSKFT